MFQGNLYIFTLLTESVLELESVKNETVCFVI